MIERNFIINIWRSISRNSFRSLKIKVVDIKSLNKKFLFFLRFVTSPLRVLPDYFIIGGLKCGTTSLHNYLINHPNVIPALTKEIHFFNFNYNKGINWYKAFFPTKTLKIIIKSVFNQNLIVGEATPLFFNLTSLKRIRMNLPKIKIILLLRNPVDRAFSHYNYRVRRGKETLIFEERIDKEMERTHGRINEIFSNDKNKWTILGGPPYLTSGIYVELIKYLKKYFNEKQIHIIKSEVLFENPRSVLKDLYKFLNLTSFNLEKYQSYNIGKYPKMNGGTRKKLLEYFKPYNKELYNYLGRDFGWDK